MNKKSTAIVIGLIVIALAVAVVASRPAANTPEQNKAIELKAFEANSPDMCNEIRGESFRFGPTDEQLSISEGDAIKLCQTNIKKGIRPARTGG